jgi:hypothetical protein
MSYRWIYASIVTGFDTVLLFCFSRNAFSKHFCVIFTLLEELNGLAASAFVMRSRKVNKVRKGWVTKNLLSLAPPYYRRYVKPLVATKYVCTHQSALRPLGLRSVLLVCYP